MKRSCSILFVLPVLLGLLPVILPAAAGAKELRSATICGASGCRNATQGETSRALAEEALAEGGGPMVPPPSHGAPWYELRATVGGEGAHARLRLAIVPALDLIRASDGPGGRFNWMSMTATGEHAYARLTQSLEPLPASSLRGVASTRGKRAGAQSREDPAPHGSSGGTIWAGILIGASALGIGAGMEWRRRRRRPD